MDLCFEKKKESGTFAHVKVALLIIVRNDALEFVNILGEITIAACFGFAWERSWETR